MTPLTPKIPKKKVGERRKRKRKKSFEKKGVNGVKWRHSIQKAMIHKTLKGVFVGATIVCVLYNRPKVLQRGKPKDLGSGDPVRV